MEEQHYEEDLRFVREVVTRSPVTSGTATPFLICALVVLIGFPLPDFISQEGVLWYWTIAGPLGFVLAALAGALGMQRSGQQNARLGRQHLLHWGVMLVVIGLAFLLPLEGRMTWAASPPLALLVVAFSYVLAGIHLDRRFLMPGVLFAAGFLLLVNEVAFAWTIAGVLSSAALVVGALTGRRAAVTEHA